MKRKLPLEQIFTVLTVLLAVAVTCFPYRHAGLYGYEPDILYHLNRIEGVRLALLSGHYPAAVYSNFFGGEGYGSPLFYPDLLLVIPAFLRILGLSPVAVFKVTAALFAALLAIVCKYAMKLVTGRWESALAGTALFTMSQFVLADLMVRAGFSSYLSYVFLPLLLAGLYDFFALKGERPWLIGLALGGLILTHTLNAFLGVLLTVIVTLLMLCTKAGRQALTDPARIRRLLIAALVTLALTAWYWMPLLEQMMSGTDFVYRHPWADVSEFTQSFEDFFVLTGYFFNVAHVGIGVPILVFITVRLFAGAPHDAAIGNLECPEPGRYIARTPRDARVVFGDLCYFLGLFLLAAMTKLLPWGALSHTPLNQLQFTFRLYPWALIFLCFGIAQCFARIMARGEAKGAAGFTPASLAILITSLILASAFGIVQNRTVSTADDEAFHCITQETLEEESGSVGRGEWLPAAFDTDVESWAETIDQDGLTIPARIWYKGYRAEITSSDGTRTELATFMGDDGRVHVDNPEGLTGEITITYHRTFCQAFSLFLSILALVLLICSRLPWARNIKQLLRKEKHHA